MPSDRQAEATLMRAETGKNTTETFEVNSLNSSPAGFTLIELLTVLIIIAILAGLIVGAAKYALTKAGTSQAKTEVASMEGALESYKNDNGVYPAVGPAWPRASASGYPGTT